LIVSVCVVAVGAAGMSLAAGARRAGGDSKDIKVKVFGLDVLTIEVPSGSGPRNGAQTGGTDCQGQSRCQTINLKLGGGDSEIQYRNYNIVPVYEDGWPQCVKGDANTPGNFTARYGDYNTIQLSVTVTGGVFDACGYKESRMRWRVTTTGAYGRRTGIGTVELRKNPGGDTYAQCGDRTQGGFNEWRCQRPNSNTALVSSDR
jgi:hypothetical protein